MLPKKSSLNIVVCIKPTIESSNISYDSRTGTPVRPDRMILSDGELMALQTALDHKKRYGGLITALSVADQCADPLLHQTLQAGADRAVRLWYADGGDPLDTYAAAAAAAAAVTTLAGDLVICAARSADLSNEFFPAALAEMAHYELASRAMSMASEDGVICVVQKLDGGWRTESRVRLPAVIAVEDGITKVRHSTVLGRIYRVGLERRVETWTPDVVGLDEMPRSLVKEMGLSLPRVRAQVLAPESTRVSAIDRLRRRKPDAAESRQLKLVGSPESIAKELLGHFQKWLA